MQPDINPHNSLVSVIVPIYNRSKYLKEAIASALNQTYKNIEIIVTDDCSSENPQAIVASFQDPRIRFRRNAKNLGVAQNIIAAVNEGRGKYIASLNDDDIWNEDFLEKLVPHLDANPELVLAFSDHYIIDGNGNIDLKATEQCSRLWKRNKLKQGIYQPFYKIGLVYQAIPSAVAAVIRKDAIDWKNFPPQAGPFWDLYLTYLACQTGGGAYYYPQRLSKYRVHPLAETMIIGSQDAQAKIRGAKASIFCFRQFMEDEHLQQYRDYFRKKWLHARTTLGIGLLKTEQVLKARSLLLHTFSQQKFNLRTLIALILSYIPQSVTRKLLLSARS